MIHWLVILYWILYYTYTGNDNGIPIVREMLLFICGAFENLIWLKIYEILMKFKKEEE